ncbi:phosphate ABC transporter substrate-binding protein PstS [Actinacidiphila glaucinigra]|uniref:Phosphate transport system substrate-binding protein n=1 Tax=Actinacidiphila glaucinigra TaxID=235986 RepID=A0A238ZDN6_9ACTN|nr:phosphate ABC transporter substrate-binding protein PstS [Actinacidiphila glaucinigra]SNR81635.1 phosphate transport system substrate-binding protein [Actinacidiphila glaucinigra]
MPGSPPAPFARLTVVSALSLLAALLFGATPAVAATYVPISGVGSTWSQNALDQWQANVRQYGMSVSYAGTGSSDGRDQFRNGTVDYAVSEIPYGVEDSSVVDSPPSRRYAYVPNVAGGTSFMYNLTIGGKRVDNLRLSGEVIARIFTGRIKVWNDPAIKADNPALASVLPARPVVPVVRSDGSGTTAQFSTWMSKQYPSLWDDYCGRAGRSTPCGTTSNYPKVPGGTFVSQFGSNGVSGYVAQTRNVGTITYVEYSYAVYTTRFPVAKVLNKAGYYVEPTARSVAVALQKARINEDSSSPGYLTQNLDDVYDTTDPRAYPLSSYSYMIVPTGLQSNFTAQKGKTLGAFAYYFLCQGQQHVDRLGYSPLPVNLVQAGLDQVRRIPGVDVQNIDIKSCHNPTFSTDGSNTLATTAPYPSACDRVGGPVCDGTAPGGGRQSITTTLEPGALLISVEGNPHVELPSPVLDPSGEFLHTSGQMTPVTVTDTRPGNIGWTASGQVGDFTGPAGSVIDGSSLTWAPTIVDRGNVPSLRPGAPVVRGDGYGLKEPRTLATGIGPGTADAGAGLDLDAPTSTPPGTYTAVLTLTVI